MSLLRGLATPDDTMDFLNDLLENDESLAIGTVNTDPTVHDLVVNAAKAGNVQTLRAALQRGQVTPDAPEELVMKIVGIAGSQIGRMDPKERAERAEFVKEWVDATSPVGADNRQARLDAMLQACFSKFSTIHDAVASQLVEMGANPLVQAPSPAVFVQGSKTAESAKIDAAPAQPEWPDAQRFVQAEKRWSEELKRVHGDKASIAEHGDLDLNDEAAEEARNDFVRLQRAKVRFDRQLRADRVSDLADNWGPQSAEFLKKAEKTWSQELVRVHGAKATIQDHGDLELNDEKAAGARARFEELRDAQVLSVQRKEQAAQEAAAAAQAKAEPLGDPRMLAVIGTAGRDKDKPLTKEIWQDMKADLSNRVQPNDTLVSGGAAWADHLAVAMFLEGKVAGLVLHLPAPLLMKRGAGFEGPASSAASAANYYHGIFAKAIGEDTVMQIYDAIDKGAKITSQPIATGYGAMFARNKLVAEDSDSVVAYTFGDGDTPADGGTKNTWDQITGQRTHVPIQNLKAEIAAHIEREVTKAKAASEAKASTPEPTVTKEAVSPAPAAPSIPKNEIPIVTMETGPGRDLAGARLGVTQSIETTLSQAMYGNAKSTGDLVRAAVAQNPSGGIPIVGTLHRYGETVEVNAAGFALADANLKQLDMVIKAVDLNSDKVREGLGQAIDQAIKLRLHEFGSDEVHHGIAKLLAVGAKVNDVQALVSQRVTLVDSPCLKFYANGQIIDGERPLAGVDAENARTVGLPVALLNAPGAKTVSLALSALCDRGWSINEPMTYPKDGSQGLATVAHFAAMRGDPLIINAVKDLNGDMKAPDSHGKTPIHYAFTGLNPESAKAVDELAYNQLKGDYAREFAMKKALDEVRARGDDYVSQMHSQSRVPEADAAAASPAPQGGAQGAREVAARGPTPAPKGGSTSVNPADLDDVNAMLADAAASDRDEDRGNYVQSEPDPVPAAPAPAPEVPPPAENQVSRAADLFARFRNRQETARAALGKPLGQEAQKADEELQRAQAAQEVVPKKTRSAAKRAG